MEVKVYLKSNAIALFPARDRNNAREIAKRIITEGLWVIDEDKTESYYPVDQVYKVKIYEPAE